MKEEKNNLLRQMITDFHAAPLPEPSEREGDLDIIPRGVRKAVTFTGMRRSGKTWAVYRRIQLWGHNTQFENPA